MTHDACHGRVLGISGIISESYPHHAGSFLRSEVISYLPRDDLLAASSTCHAMRNSVHDTMKGSQISLPSELHILAKRISLFEWGLSNGYQLQPDRDDDDRDVELHVPDTWVRRIGSFTRACLAGNLEILRYLIEVKEYQASNSAPTFAAYGGHIHCLEWLNEIEIKNFFIDKCLPAAAYAGHIGVLNWLRTRCYGGKLFSTDQVETIGHHAALGGHRSIIQWLIDSGYLLSQACCSGAAEGGHLELLQWLIEIGCPVPYEVTNQAAVGGSKTMLLWLRDAGYEWDEGTSQGAAEGGHLETLQWLIENGCSTPEDPHVLTSSAALGGQIPMLEWLQDNGYPYMHDACVSAAYYGQLPTLKFLRNQGCPWNSEVTRLAALSGRINTLRWALANCCPYTADITFSVVNEGICARLGILKVLVEEFHLDIDTSRCIATAQELDRADSLSLVAWLQSKAFSNLL